MKEPLGLALENGCGVLAEDRLRLLETLVGQLSDGVFITEAQRRPGGRRILWVNGAVERMTGYEAGELIGKTPRILQGPRTSREVAERIGRAVEAYEPVEAELINYRKDGTPFWSDLRISPVFDDGGRCTHFVALKRDATVRKTREELDRLRLLTLEHIAEGAPLPAVLEQIAAMVESQSLQAAVTIESVDGERLVPLASGRGASGVPASCREDLRLSEAQRAQLLEGRPILCPALAQALAAVPSVNAPCALCPIRARFSGELLGVVRAHARDCSCLGEHLMQAMSEAAQLAEIAFQCDADRRRLERLALYDPLTNLPNRMLLSVRLEHQVASADRQQSKFALAMLDLDQFKLINDTLGHAAGDFVLRESADRLGLRLRACDTLARFGGDEFVLLLQDVASRADAECGVRRIVAGLAGPFVIDGHEIAVQASFGVALYPDDSRDTQELFRRADLAMYALRETHAKQPVAAHDRGASVTA